MLLADNLILETATGATTGLADWIALQGSLPGYRSFASRMVDSDTFHYLIRAVDVVARPTGQWEIGRGAYRANEGTPALQRLQVFASSSADGPVAFDAGPKHISLAHVAPNTDAIRFDQQTLLGLDIAGAVVYFAMASPPGGWLKANGAQVSRTTYARLFARIGTTYGVGDGASTFNLPDGRGEFLRGWDDGRTLDNGRTFGSVQSGMLLSHAHGLNDPGHAHGVYDPGHAHGAWTDAQGQHTHGFVAPQVSGIGSGSGGVIARLVDGDVGKQTDGAGNHGHNVGIGASGTGVAIYAAGTGQSVQAAGGYENRPRNLALLACVKY